MVLSEIRNGVALSCATEIDNYLRELETLVKGRRGVLLDYDFIFNSPFNLCWDPSAETTIKNLEAWAKSVGILFIATGRTREDFFLLVCLEE